MDLDEVRQLVQSGIENYNQGNLKNAIADFEAALRIDSTDSQMYVLLAAAYTDSGLYDKAITTLQEALLIHNSKPNLYIMLARAYARNGDYQHAVNCYDTIIALEPENLENRISRADLLIRADHPSRAVEDVEIYLQIDQSSLAYEIRGRARKALNDLDNAIEDYSESLRLEPKSISARIGRAQLYQRVGQFSKALEDYTYLVNNNPDNTDFLFMRAETYREAGEYEYAQQDFETAFCMYDQSVLYKDRFKSRIFSDNIYGNIESAKALVYLEPKKLLIVSILPRFLL
ncbi:MAG: tetratricopeptide repeat protein [Leptolyngbyaceae cyanobacterium SL_5_14]|nr:tetratricopeptide repeat protein [Leptolyngbyaceae cyanobacterium SL_5_14]